MQTELGEDRDSYSSLIECRLDSAAGSCRTGTELRA